MTTPPRTSRSRRFWLGLAAVAVVVACEVLRLAGVEVSSEARAEVLAALGALVAADSWRPLGQR